MSHNPRQNKGGYKKHQHKRHHKSSSPSQHNSGAGHKPGNKSRYGQSNASTQSLLPPAALLQEYEYISEGSVARILALAESEQAHRHDWEAAVFKTQVVSQRIGQFCGCVIILTLIAASWHLAYSGYEIASATLAGIGFLSLAVNAIRFQNKQSTVRQRPRMKGKGRG